MNNIKGIVIAMCCVVWMILFINAASALEFDNVRNEKVTTFDGKNVLGNTLLERYKPIEITNAFGLGETLFEGYLSEHTNECGIDCISIIEVKTGQDGILIQDIIFKTLQEDSSWIEQGIRDYQFYINTEGEKTEVDDYDYVDSGKISLNGTKIFNYQKVGSHLIDSPTWTLYNAGEEVKEGIYQIKLEGEKKPSRTVDWVIKTNGEWLNEWATWGNISLGDDGEIILNYPEDIHTLLVNLINFNATANVTGGAFLMNMSLWTNETGTFELKNTTALETPDIEVLTGIVYTAGGSQTGRDGIRFTMNTDASIAQVIKDSAVTATVGYLLNSSKDVLASATFVGDYATFSTPIALSNGVSYYVMADSGGASYTYRQLNTVTYPISSAELDYTIGAATDGNDYAGWSWEIAGVVFTNATETNSTQTWDRTITEGIIWNVEACDTDDVCGFAPNNYTIIPSTTPPTITIQAPSGTLDYSGAGLSETLNVTFTDTSLDVCWYDYNGTNITIDGCSTGVKNSTTFLLESGNTNMTVWANDSLSNLNSEFTDWSYKIFENSNTYNLETAETAEEDFSVNVTANSSLTAVTLDYDGTDYVLIDQGSGIWNVTIQIPATPQNNTLKYVYTYGEDIINSNNFSQNINGLIFGQCNATNTFIYLNFTFANENNQTIINGSIPNANFTYYLGDGSITKENIVSNSTELSEYTFCGSPSTRNITVDSRVQYELTGHPQRIFNPVATTYENKTNDITLYLLPTTDGIYVTFQLINTAEQIIEGVFINATRLVGSTLQLVGGGFTDSSGGLTMWLNPNFIHNFVFAKTGFTPLINSFAPTQTSYTVALGGGINSSNTFDYTKGITFDIHPRFNSVLTDGFEYAFNFTIASADLLIEAFGFDLWNATTKLLTVADTINGGMVGDFFDVTGQTSLEMKYWWKINNTYMNASTTYVVLTGDGVNWSINNTMNDFRTYLGSGMFGMGNFATALLIFLIVFTFVGIMAFKYGLTSPTAIAILMFSIVLFLDVGLNLMAFLNPFGVNHFITIFLGLIMIATLFREMIR